MVVKDFFKKAAALALSGVLVLSSFGPARAADLVKEAEVTSEAPEEEQTDTEVKETETETETEKDPYIILLPQKEGISYSVDGAHRAEDFSTAEYSVLLYTEGEDVSLGVNPVIPFTVVDASSMSEFIPAGGIHDGKVSFKMPASDLMVVFIDTGVDEKKDKDSKGASEKADEAEKKEAADKDPLDKSDVTVATEAPDKNEEMPADDELKDAEDANLEFYPETGSVLKAPKEYVWMFDSAVDCKAYVPDTGFEDADTTYVSGILSFNVPGTYEIIFKQTLKSDPEQFWYVSVPMEVVKEKGLATFCSENFEKLMHKEQDDSYKGVVPEESGSTVDGGEYTVTAGEDFDLWDLNLGYDLSLYNVGLYDDGGFDASKEGTYKVVYEIGSYNFPAYQWFAECTLKVVKDAENEKGTVTVCVKSGVLEAAIELADGTEGWAAMGTNFVTDKPVRRIVVTSPRNVDIDPEISVSRNGEKADTILSEDLKDNIYTVTMDDAIELGSDAYCITVDYPGYDPEADGTVKSTGGLERPEFVDRELLEEKIATGSIGTQTGKVSRSVPRASTVVKTKSFTNIGTVTQLSGAVHNYNPPGTAYNMANIKFTDSFKNELDKFCSDNNLKLGSKQAVPDSEWTSCSSGHQAAGWPNTSYCQGTSATATLTDTDGDGTADRLTVAFNAYGPSGYQTLSGLFTRSVEEDLGKLKVVKKTDSPKFVSSFSGYRINTMFTLYSDKACTEKVGSFRIAPDTDSAQGSATLDLEPGKYWIKEYGRCPGHASASGQVWGPYVVKAGETTVTNDEDKIINEVFYFRGKILGKTGASGEGPLANAVYRVTTSIDTENGTESFKWFFKTDANGEIYYDNAHYLASFGTETSSSLIEYKGGVALPKCSLSITEVQAPDGYLLDTATYTLNIAPSKDGNGEYSSALMTVTPLACTDRKDEGYIRVKKYLDPEKTVGTPLSSEYSFEGAQYTVYKDQACTQSAGVIDIVADGSGMSKALKAGQTGTKYWVKETKLPACGAYDWDTKVYDVTVTTENTVLKPVDIGSYEPLKTGDLTLTKALADMKDLSEEQLQKIYDSGKLEGIKFVLTHENVVNLKDKGRKVIVTDKYGKGHEGSIDGSDIISDMVYGNWTITEDPATVPAGYKCIEPTDIRVDGESNNHVDFRCDDEPYEGFIEIAKVDACSGNVIVRDSATFYILDEYGDEVYLNTDKNGITNRFTTGAKGDLDEGKIIFSEPLKGGTYTLYEEDPPKGYEKFAEGIPFTVESDATKELPIEVVMEDDPIKKPISITKVDSKTGDHCGAGYSFNIVVEEDIVDGAGEVRKDDVTGEPLVAGTIVETLTTGEDGTATSKPLYLGKYYIEETALPQEDDGRAINLEKIHVELADEETEEQPMTAEVSFPDEPTAVEIYKTDTVKKQPMAGITFRVKEKDTADDDSQLYKTDADGKILVEYLKKNTTYVVYETATLPGYNLSLDVSEFTVDEFGLIEGKAVHRIDFTNQPNEWHISKKDITTGEELPGAALSITDANGKVVEEWISTTEPHVIYGLPAGTYTLTEVTSPDGYELAKSIAFEVKDTMIVQKLEMQDFPYREVEISKVDITNGKELPGAHLTLSDSEDNVIDEWVSTKKVHKVKVPSGTYTLTETKPADGYVTADSVIFTVEARDEFGDVVVQHVEMEDDVTKVEISKQDITTGKELPGAHLEIRTKGGKLVEKWTSTDKPHYIEKLPVGDYTLVETSAPDGYTVAETVKFTVKDTEEIQHVVMKDSPVVASPKTGDETNVAKAVTMATFALILLIASVILFRGERSSSRKRKKDE